MITRMVVDNFKALRHVEVDLAPFTVLIGPNDTGKTSFLEAVYAIAESTRSQLANCFWSQWQHRELVYAQSTDSPVRFVVELKRARGEEMADKPVDQPMAYSVSLEFGPAHSCRLREEQFGASMSELGNDVGLRRFHGDTAVCAFKDGGAPPAVQEYIRQVLRGLFPAALTRLDVEELATPSRLLPNRRYPYDPTGYGLATCIAEMKLGTGGNFEALRKDFCTLFSKFDNIVIGRNTVTSVERNEHFRKFVSSQGEGYSLILVRDDGLQIPADLVSGGMLVMLAFQTLAHLQEPRKLLLIEEPENGLHPGLLKEVVKILRGLVTRRNDCQVIVTTHSPLLLDEVKPDEVRVFQRNEQNDVEVFNLADVPDIRDRLKYLMLGELVYNEGEQELVKEIEQHASAHSR